MNFIANQSSKALIHELMPGERSYALKFGGNHESFEMGIVITRDPDSRVFETGLNKAGDLGWLHYSLVSVFSGRAV